MDPAKLVQILQATLDPQHQLEAHKQLDEVHKIIGFAPLLLQLSSSEQVPFAVRQAGVIYLKNVVHRFWEDKERENPSEPIPFSIHEQDRSTVRQNIVAALIAAPPPIRTQLGVIISSIIKSDFPARWPEVVEQIGSHLQSEHFNTWLGALITLHQLVKHFEYKPNSEREPLNQAMIILLPIMMARCKQLLPDQSELSVTIQKQVLKCFYALTQYTLSMEVVTREIFTQWMELCRTILASPIPEALGQLDAEDQAEAIWWKIKKWCLHILVRTFERYGSPGSVMKEYSKFADWYLRTFVSNNIVLVLNLLERNRQHQFVSPRCLQQSLNYISQGVNHASSWKLIKPHMQQIITDILFPLLCHSDEDQELWELDPIEYIRTKYDVFEEYLSPSMAAQSLLHSAASKRKQVLTNSIDFCMGMLMGQRGGPPTARQKDGVLHILGALSSLLLKKDLYKNQVETLLTTYVYPEFQSEHGFLRARANWSLQYFMNTKFKDINNLGTAVELVRQSLCNDKELPVRVEAAVALQALIDSHESAYEYIKPNIKGILLQLLQLMKDTENDELTGVMQNLVSKYEDEILPVAVEMTTHLCTIFQQVVESDEAISDGDDKILLAMGLLTTIESVLTVIQESETVVTQVEPVVDQLIKYCIQNTQIEFYDEILAIICCLTSFKISDAMWVHFHTIYDMFNNDGFDCFTEMMPALHNYITVDPDKFSSNPKHLEMIYNICKQVLEADAGEDAEAHAAKLIEVLILQYRGVIDSAVQPFITLALERLTKGAKMSELRTMCLQVVIAGLYYNPKMLFELLNSLQLADQFIKQWLIDTDCFLGIHDRKMCILGLCCLMNTPNDRDKIITDAAQQIIPSALLVFRRLKCAYQTQADLTARINNIENDSDEEGEADELEDDEDEAADENDDSDDESDLDSSDTDGETQLEAYTTVLESATCEVDEYIVFKEVLSTLHSTDSGWYSSLTGHLDKTQQKEVQDVLTIAEQKKAVAESKKIELQGGFQYQNISVPTSFNFGGAPPQI